MPCRWKCVRGYAIIAAIGGGSTSCGSWSRQWDWRLRCCAAWPPGRPGPPTPRCATSSPTAASTCGATPRSYYFPAGQHDGSHGRMGRLGRHRPHAGGHLQRPRDVRATARPRRSCGSTTRPSPRHGREDGGTRPPDHRGALRHHQRRRRCAGPRHVDYFPPGKHDGPTGHLGRARATAPGCRRAPTTSSRRSVTARPRRRLGSTTRPSPPDTSIRRWKSRSRSPRCATPSPTAASMCGATATSTTFPPASTTAPRSPGPARATAPECRRAPTASR